MANNTQADADTQGLLYNKAQNFVNSCVLSHCGKFISHYEKIGVA